MKAKDTTFLFLKRQLLLLLPKSFWDLPFRKKIKSSTTELGVSFSFKID